MTAGQGLAAQTIAQLSPQQHEMIRKNLNHQIGFFVFDWANNKGSFAEVGYAEPA